jgi:hypothetical protein
MTETPMTVARANFTLSTMPDGTVIAVGGCSGACYDGSALASAEVYLPMYEDWTPVAAMPIVREGATATPMRNGQLLVTGGNDGRYSIYSSAETYTLPLLTGSPSQGPVGTQVTLHGHGLDAFENVRITFDFASIGSARTRSDGSFTATVTIPSSGVGQHPIRAQGRTSYGQATFEFQVTGTG